MPATAPLSAAESTTAATRELAFAEGSSNKFWIIELSGSSHTVRSATRPSSGYGSEHKLLLGQVPPVVVSEVLADVQVLKTKSK